MSRRALAALAVAAGCGGAPAPAPAPPVPTEDVVAARGCHDAAAGLEASSRHVRAPDASVLAAARARCVEEAWPPTAIECLAAMTPDALPRCLGLLPAPARAGVLELLGGAGGGDGERGDGEVIVVPGPAVEAAELDAVAARLDALRGGLPSCDRMAAAVAALVRCARIPAADRLALGAATVDALSLPTHKLSADAQARVAAGCASSLEGLARQAADAGCAP